MDPFFVNILALVLFIWTIPWKVYAVWLAVKHNHRRWFVALILFNTFSILELYYIFGVAKKNLAAVKRDFRAAWIFQ